MEKILEEERSRGASGRKRKYTHFTPEARASVDKYADLCCLRTEAGIVRVGLWRQESMSQ